MSCASPHGLAPLLVTAHVASTLGDALNGLLAVLGMAVRLNASVGLPWLQKEMFHTSSGTWYTDVGRDGFDFLELLNMTRLRDRVLQFGDAEVRWAQAERNASRHSSTRVGLLLQRRGLHWLHPEMFDSACLHKRGRSAGASLGCAAFERATREVGCTEGTRTKLELPPLGRVAAFDELVGRIRGLQLAYRGPRPMLAVVRGDGELSCLHWAFPAEVLRVVAHIDLLRPILPPQMDEAVANTELGLARRCAYSFWRFAPNLHETYSRRGNMSILSVTPHATPATLYHFRSSASLQLGVAAVARSLVATTRNAGASCIYIDTYGGAPSALKEAIEREGVQTVSLTRVTDQYRLHAHHRRGGSLPMRANALKLFYARHSRLLICEVGSQWCDLVSMLRTNAGLPSLIMSATALEQPTLSARPTGAPTDANAAVAAADDDAGAEHFINDRATARSSAHAENPSSPSGFGQALGWASQAARRRTAADARGTTSQGLLPGGDSGSSSATSSAQLIMEEAHRQPCLRIRGRCIQREGALSRFPYRRDRRYGGSC
jgi:hypothetical protein